MKPDDTPLNIPNLSPETPLRKAVWTVRRTLRDIRQGKDIFENTSQKQPAHYRIYKKAEDFTNKYFPTLAKVPSKKIATARIRDMIAQEGYDIVESDETKPWGAYYRIANDQAERFITSLFPGLTVEDAKLGRDDVEISPKFLLVEPGQRLSWQYHDRRAERWRFLSSGMYVKSKTDKQTPAVQAPADTIVQFETGERHRLCAHNGSYTLVAEIWQHTDPDKPSNEDDIIRLQDDYSR